MYAACHIGIRIFLEYNYFKTHSLSNNIFLCVIESDSSHPCDKVLAILNERVVCLALSSITTFQLINHQLCCTSYLTE